ncbi:hypothetical protein H8D85_01555 [bacterium]|nr:hypothetical protein [bacterium]
MLLDPMYDMPAARPSTFAVDRSVVNTDGSITPRGNKLKSMGNLKQKYKKDMAALNRRESIHNEAFEADQASRRKFFGGRGLNAIKEKIRDFGVGLEKNKMKRGFEQGKRDVLKTYSEDLEEQIT